jgi:DNA-binding SARP family transcriptional activator
MMGALATGFAIVGRLLRGLLAAVVLLAVVVGLPVGLVVFVGWPLPDHMPGRDELGDALASPLDDQTVLDILAVLAWMLWVHFLRDVAVEVVLAAADISAARHGRTLQPRRRGGPVRFVAAILVGVIAGAILVDLLRGAARPANTSVIAAHAAARTPAVAAAPALTHAAAAGQVSGTGPRPAIATPARPAITATTAAGRGGPDAPAWARDAPGGAHHVVKGDNLWDIAEKRLGDPLRWREIYVLSRDRPQANGYALLDPDEIHIGWWLAMPARVHATTPQPPPAPPGSAAPGGASQQTDVSGSAGSATPTPAAAVPGVPAPAGPAPGAGAVTPAPAVSPTEAAPAAGGQASDRGGGGAGVVLPSQAWVGLGLAAMVAAVAGLLRLQRRRRARLSVPIEIRTGATPSPVPQTLRPVAAAGSCVLDVDFEGSALPGVLPARPAVPAPVGVSAAGDEVSLFALPGTGVALTGDGAVPAARAVLAAVLSTGVTEHMSDRPLVVTTTQTLARLLPADVPAVGLDPGNETFDGERLVVAGSLARAVTALEEEMVHRRRLLDTMDEPTVATLNARHDHAEHQPPFVLLAEADSRYAARVAAVAQHRTALHLHPVLLGECDAIPGYRVASDGFLAAPAADDTEAALAGGRLATLAAQDLADVLDLVRQAAPRAEAGVDIDDPFAGTAAVPPPAARADLLDLAAIPTPTGQRPAPVRLSVLGPLTLATEAGAISSGVRSGSLAVLALLAAHPAGRTLEQLADDLHPNAEPDAGTNRVHTDIVAARTVLRETTGITGRGRFIVHGGARGGRYRIDPDLVEVDLWRMLSAIDRANKANDDETAALAALQEAAQLYGGDFAAGQDRAWALDYATTYRHQILNVYARIAELLEADHPDQAVAALETAIALDPVNEELYQRLMRIHGRQHRPDAVRRTLRLLEDRLAGIGEAEPSEATRRVATRQLTASATP